MKPYRRYLSGSLATLLILGAMMSTGAYAKSYEDVTADHIYAEQIEILSDIGVIKGTGDTEFSPEAPVTREQMALLLFRLMIGKDSAGTLNTSPFTDLYDKTYHGAISWANASGYILGTSDRTFEPAEGITMQDAMAMLVRALGHSSLQMNAGYPWTYIDAAVKLGLDDGMETVPYTKELTRAEVAGLLYNALTAEYLIPRTASNGMTFYESTTIIERVFGYEIDEAVIVATNKHSLGAADTVTKTGYVSVRTDDGLLTVRYEELGLAGDAEAHLGKNIKLVHKRDDKTRLTHVLGCTELGKTVQAQSITVGKNNAYIEIGGVKYQVVEALSDAMSTNANELLVYAWGNGGRLVPITSNAALADLLGVYDARLIFDNKDSTVADRLIIKSYGFGQLKISGGKVNLAGNLKESELTVINPDKAVSGDYVLYYFNADTKTLEIASALPVSESGTVTRLTADSAVVGGKTYKLGYSKLGISAESVRAQLAVGGKVKVVTFDGCILAIASADTPVYAPSQYLIAHSATTPVFTDGRFGYVMEAVIDGIRQTVFVSSPNVEVGRVYRYTADANGTLTLIPYVISEGVIESGNSAFVQSNAQNDEMAFIIESADGTTLIRGDSHHTLSAGRAPAFGSHTENASSVSFITDKDTLIITVKDGVISLSRGIYTSSVSIADGASVTAIFDNEVGSVETLRYLYVSDGELGSVDATASSVKVLAMTGRELIGDKVYTIYSVLNLATGEIQSMMSLDTELTAGKNYLTDTDGLISSSEASVDAGILTGYTGSTATVGDTTYALAADVKIVRLNSDGTVSAISLADAHMGRVELILKDGKLQSLILLGPASFTASFADGGITVGTDYAMASDHRIAVESLKKLDADTGEAIPVDLGGRTAERIPGSTFAFRLNIGELESGAYILRFSVDGKTFESGFAVS